MFQFVSLPLATSRLTDGAAVDQEQIETSDLITRALYWQFRDRDAANQVLTTTDQNTEDDNDDDNSQTFRPNI